MRLHPSLSRGRFFHLIGRADGAGFGRRGGGHGFGGRGGFSRRGRKFAAQDLELLLLSLLAEAPRHGYELIKALEERSNGGYVPSPGMIYPSLTHLEELGYALSEAEGNRKRYSVSDAGRAYLDSNREHVDLALARIKVLAKEMELVRQALADQGGEEQGAARVAEYFEARHALRRALHARSDSSPEEQRRIAAILRRAVAEIEGSGEKSR